MKTTWGLKWSMGIILFASVLFSCDDWFDDDDDDDGGGNTPPIGDVVAKNLDTPWEMAQAPDGRIFVTERPGVIVVVQNDEQRVWIKLDSVVEEVGESGLTGFALDPEFSSNGYVYFAYTYAESKGPLKLVNKIVRYKETSTTAPPVFDKVIIDGIPGNFLHNVGPLEFGPDGMLYAAVGETFIPELAQDENSLNGKILRMTRDGSIPADNPFQNSLVYTLGHRNPQGLAFHPETNDLWSTEHGPSEEQGCCRDEINRIEAGKNYGWPVIRGSEQRSGYETPEYYSGDTTTWAPAGGFFVKQGAWKGSLLFTGLRGQALYRAVLNESDPTKVDVVERYFYRTFGRLRNVIEGSDGRIYIAVSDEDGRGNPSSEEDVIIALTQQEIEEHSSGTTGRSTDQD